MGSSLRSRGGVFISYRREETAGQAGCLYEHLADRFGEDRVFKDTPPLLLVSISLTESSRICPYAMFCWH
jgi:hypothetical protein